MITTTFNYIPGWLLLAVDAPYFHHSKVDPIFKPVGTQIINDAIPIPSFPYHYLTLSMRYFYAEHNATKNHNTLETSRFPIIDNVILFYYLT